MLMRVLFADKYPADQLEQLRAAGHDCELRPELTADDLAEAVGDADVLVVRSTKVTRETLEQAPRLKLIIRAGSGYNTIDVDAAGELGIAVSNVPGKNAIAVAELAFGLLLAIDRNIPDNVIDLRAGRWDKTRYQKARGVFDRSVGVLGIGAIGLAFAERAAAFGMQVHVLTSDSRSAPTVERLARIAPTYHADLASLASAVDVLSVHVPADPSTKGLIGGPLLDQMRDDAILINTARGDLIDENALLSALDRGIRAGLDVYPDEPGTGTADFVSKLAQHPNVYGTHHIGASTEQAQNAVADEVVAMIGALESGEVSNVVNADRITGSRIEEAS